jgi:hypothetical protein
VYPAIIMRISTLVVLLGLTACQASVSAKANSNGDVKADADANMKSSDTHETMASKPPPAATGDTTTSSAPVSATASSCPFQCSVSDGADSTLVSADDLARYQQAFSGTISSMRQCIGGDGWSRHRSSPVLNVRVNFSGDVTDVGIDTRGFDNYDSCLAAVARPLPDGKFAGPADVRCAEKCERPAMKARGVRPKPKKP